MTNFVITQQMINIAIVGLLAVAVVLLLILVFRNSNNREIKEDLQDNFDLFYRMNSENLVNLQKSLAHQLGQVQQGLGEMRNLATEVGGIKKVLGNVKTRGILGEIQLEAILQDILVPEQYATNVATIPGSANRVEFALCLPGENGSVVYLPIDSKFPGDRYEELLNAKESGNREYIERAYKELENVIKSEARDIKTKYVEVPYTTNFGIMFLPSEGLYAEVLGRGLLQKLQREYQVTLAGPSTMAAFINSLQMGFQTLAIQQRSNEVWELLGAVKTEFEKFDACLDKVRKNLETAQSELENLVGARTKAINKKLREV